MPDLEISNLPALAEAGVAATDPLAIADISASETKKVTVKDLIEAGVALIDNTSIPGSKIGTLSTDQVATGAIQDDAVTNAKIEHPSISLGGLTLVLGSTDATPALDLTDATNYPASSLTGTITNTQLAGSIANSKLANSSVSFGGVSLALGGTDATPAFDLQDATGYKTTSLVGTITNAQLAGSIANSKLVASSVSLGGVSVALGGTDATPAFNLTDATNYPTSALVGTITNAQLAGSIANAKLVNSSVSLGGVSIALGGTDATPAFDLVDATGYLTSSLVGTITNAQLAGSIDVSKLSSSTDISLGGVSIALGSTDATPAFNLSDATHYPTSALVGTITNAQLAGSIANSKLANSSVSLGGITVALGASDATPAFDLTDATGYKTTNLVGTITNAQLAGSIDLSKLVSSSASIGGVTITLGTTDATPAFDLQDATGYPASALVGTITNAQLAGSIAATKLVSGSITSTQLGTNSVTDTELANNSVDTGAVQNGAITNDKVETSTSATTGLDGATKLRDGTVTPAKLNTSNLDRSLNVASGNLGINNAVTGGAATRSGISYNAEGLITGTAALVAGDLPVSTATAVGGVSIPTAGGLTITGTGAVSIAATTTAATATKVTYNTFGQIISSAALAATDLPIGTANTVGALSVPTGGPLSVDSNGALTVSNSGVSAGTGTKVTVDAKGRVTTLANLSDSDLPNHSAALLTSGSIAAARISNDSIDGSKLSDSSTTIFQSIAQQGYPTAQFNGQLLFDTVSEDAFIWDGTAWQAITTLTKGSLVFGGTFNANTSQMVSTTSAGIAAGLSVGSNLPTPSETVDGVYVVVSTGGTPTSPAPVVALAPPDYILGVTNTSGSSWNEVDLSQTVAGQVASNITFTPYGQLSSTNVQDALQELETEKMSFAGGTITGQVLIGNTGSLVFEGSSVDDYEITLAVADPTTSDKTITLPDVTGTVITSGDTGTVTSTMIADGTIVNADINASAAIALTKLQGIASAKIIVGDSSGVATEVAVTGDIAITNTGVTSITAGSIVNADISGSAAITGSKITTGTTSAVGVLQLTDSATSTSTSTAATPAAVKIAKDAADAAQATADAALPKAGGTLTDNLIIDNGKELRLSEADGDGTNYTGLKAQAQTGDITLTLPAVAPTAGQVLKADASTPTTLTWAADSATDATKMPLAGGTFTGDVTFTGDSSDGLWDKSASAFVANLTGNVTGNTSGSSGSCTGNAATATALASSVNIGGVAFDGTASINLPGVNASGTQDTSGTAALATSFTVTANNSTDETVYPLFVDGATGSQGAETDTGLTYNPSTGLLTSTGFSGVGTSLTDLDADNISAGTVDAARLGSGSSITTKFLRGDNTWQTISATPEGTAILSTGESGGTKFLREDGDGTCSWQTVNTSPAGSDTQIQFNNSGSFAGSSGLTYDYTYDILKIDNKIWLNGHSNQLNWNDSQFRIRVGSGAANVESIHIAPAHVYFLSGGQFRGAFTSTGFQIMDTNGNAGIEYVRSAADFRFNGNTASWGTSEQFVLSMPASQNDSFIDCKNTSGSLKVRTSSSSALDTTALTIANTGVATFANNVVVSGDLTVNGTTTTVNSTTVEVADKNIELGKVASPSDTTADGGGLTLKGATDKTFNWVNSTDAWTSSEHIEVASGKTFIGNVTGNVSGTSGGFTAGSASNLNAGTVSIDRLGSSGTASSSTFLRGDNSWQTISTVTPAGSNGQIQYYHNGALAAQSGFTIDNSTGDVYIAGASAGLSWDKSANELNLASGAKAKFGGGSNYAYIHYNPSATRPELYINNGNPFTLTASGGDIAEIHQTGTVILKNDFLLRDGTTTKIQWDKSDDALEFAGQTKIKLGSSGEIYTDGSGNLKIDTGNDTEFDISGTQRLKVNSQGATITGTCTATAFSGTYTGSGANLTNVNAETVDVTLSSTNANHFPLFASSNGSGQAGNTATAQDVLADGNLFYNPSTNVLTAGSFSGSGANLTSLPAGNLTGALPAINGANLTNVNANSLGGIGSGSFVRSDTSDTLSGSQYTFSSGTNEKIILSGSSSPFIRFQENTTDKAFIQYHSGYVRIYNGNDGSVLRLKDDFDFSVDDGATFNSVIHGGNVGSGGALSTKNVYVNEIHGDGSNLTNLPASGPTIDLQTGGTSIAAGKPVSVDSSGKLVEVAGSQSAITPVSPVKPDSVQTWSTASNNASYMGNVNEDANAINQTVITSGGVNYIINVWNNGSQNNYGYYVVGEQYTTGDPWSISWGTVTAFASYTRNEPPAIAKLGNTLRVVLVTASGSNSWDYWKFYGGTLNKYTKLITFNSGQTAQELLNPAPDNTYLYTRSIAAAGSWETRPWSYSMDAIEKNDDFCFVSLHCHDSYNRIFQVQWDGSNFGISDPDHLGSLYSNQTSRLKMAYKTTNPAIHNGVPTTGWIAGSMNDGQNKQMFILVDSPPNNLTFSSQQTSTHNDSSGDEIDGNSLQVFWMDDTHAHTHNQFLSFFFAAGTKYYGTGSKAGPPKIFTVHTMQGFPTNPCFKTDILSNDVLNAGTCFYWDVHSSRFILQYYRTGTYKTYLKTATLKVASGQTVRYDLNLGAEVEQTKPDDVVAISNHAPIRYARQVPINEVDNSYYIQSCWVGDSSYSNMAWLQYSQPTEQAHTGASYIGLTSSSISANATGTVNLAGTVNTQVSGLTAGSAYYLGAGGALSTTPATPTTKVGVALTSGSILLTP